MNRYITPMLNKMKNLGRINKARTPFVWSAVIATIVLSACGGDTGELTGVLGRRPWFHDQPLGTVYIPSRDFPYWTGRSGYFPILPGAK